MTPPASSNGLVDYVRDGHAAGFSFTPLKGKIPTQKGWQKAPRETLDEALAWAARGNVGLRTGSSSGVVVVDQDEGGDVEPLGLPPTATAITGSGNHHYYFATADGIIIGNSAGKLGPHIDVRGEGGQVVFPGSTHPDTGERYEWAEGLSPSEIGIAPLPQNIIDRLTAPKPPATPPTTPGKKPTRKRTQDFDRSVKMATHTLRLGLYTLSRAQPGERNDTLNKCAFHAGTMIGGGYLQRSDCEEALTAGALAIGLGADEISKTIASGIDAGLQHPRSFAAKHNATERIERGVGNDEQLHAIPPGRYDLDLYGNADRFMYLFGADVHWCEGLGKWFVWDSTCWQPDEMREVQHLADQTLAALKREALGGDDPILKWATKCLKTGSAGREMLEAVKTRTAVTKEMFNRPGWMFNAANGTVDLRTGDIVSHNRDHMLTMVSPADYDRDAQCPRWLQFLNEIMDGNTEMISALQRLAGYFLTGDIGVQILPIFYGSGGNGKNVFLDTIVGIMGPYAGEAPEGLITSRNTDEHPTEIADLMGKRLIVASETEEGRKMRIGLVKKITGNKYLKGRFMRQDFFQFERTHKTVLVTNNRPIVSESTNAIWRRLRLIPFDVTIPESKQDRQLTTRLVSEWPGILRWMVEGCVAWQERNCDLAFPDEVYAATEAYKDESDHVGDFIAERCEDFRGHENQQMRTPKERIYSTYCVWAREMGEDALSRQAFGSRMRSHGFEDRALRHDGKVQKCWINIIMKGHHDQN